MDRLLAYLFFARNLCDILNSSTVLALTVRVAYVVGPSDGDLFYPYA